MLLKEIKLLEVDDSITDQIGNLTQAFSSGASGVNKAGGSGTPKDVPDRFKTLFSDHIFTYRYEGQPAYKRSELTKGLDQDDIEDLGETLIGVRASLQQALNTFLREFSAEKLTRFTSDDGVIRTSMLVGSPTDWKAYKSKAAGLLKTNAFFDEVDSAQRAYLQQMLQEHKSQLILELSRVSSTTAFAKAQADKIEASFDDNAIDALRNLECNIALLHIFAFNCTDMLQEIMKAEPKKTTT